MDFAFEKDWNKLVKMMMDRFGEQPDVTSMVFAVGLQEVSQGPSEYKKDDKVNLIHVGICTLLEPMGYYKTLGLDDDGQVWRAARCDFNGFCGRVARSVPRSKRIQEG